MSNRIWHKGPPPHVGWWNVRLDMNLISPMWGWFDGEWWSAFARHDKTAEIASRIAAQRGALGPMHVLWSDFYPENARVPRIDPRKKK